MTNDTAATIEPTTIRKLIIEVYPAFALLAGAKLGVFTALAQGPAGVDEVAARLGVEPVRMVQLLHLLVEAGLLALEGGRFANTAESDRFLVEGRPRYMGGLHELWEHIWPAALKTADSIRAGAPLFRWMSLSEADKASYLRGLGVLSASIGRELAARWDLGRYRTIVDVAGGAGTLVRAVCEAAPHLQGSVLEHPETAPVTRQLLAEAGAAERIDVVGADILAGPVERQWDVLVVRNFIQMLSAEEAALAFKHLAPAVAPGGSLFVCDMVLDDDRLGPREVLRLGIIFVSFFDHSPMYTDSQYRGWLEAAGLVVRERFQSAIGHVILRAERPA